METLICKNSGGQIPPIDGIDYFKNRSIILYGPSNSGKSVIITHIMKSIKDSIPNVIVISPTNNVNNTYTGLVPQQLIHDEVDPELINNIYKKQEAGVEIYNNSNDINKLYSIFSSCSTSDERFKYNNFIKAYNEMIEKISNDDGLHKIVKSKKLSQLKSEHNKNMIKFFKISIKQNEENLLSNPNVSEDVKKIVRYLYYNPALLLVMDDVGGDAAKWGKYPGIRKLFFQGRHYHITFIIALQDEVMLNKDLRTNSFINIFTKESVANAYFERKTNGYPANEIKLYKLMSKTIFDKSDQETDRYGNIVENFKKLCYIREGYDFKIFYISADIQDKFKFGSATLWRICERSKKINNSSSDNEFKNIF